MGNFIPLPVFASDIKLCHPHPFLLVQNAMSTRLPIGNKLLLTIKSSKSKIEESFPKGVINCRRLNPNAHGSEIAVTIRKLINTDFFRDHLKRSIEQATIFSKTAITVVRAAKLKNRKKSAPQIIPPSIALKMFGNVIKIRLGPLPGFILKARQAGKMIKPAMIATAVSSIKIRRDSLVRDFSLFI